MRNDLDYTTQYKWVKLFLFVMAICSGLLLQAQTTWYSLNSGDWDDHTNWTLDPAGAIYINPDASYPAEVEIDDNVVVASGHDLVIPDGVAPYDSPLRDLSNMQLGTITINGSVNLKTTSGLSFAKLKGSGRLIIDGDNYPTITDDSDFITEGKGEGTVVLKASSSYALSTADTFFNLEIDAAGFTVSLDEDYTLNGSLLVKTGTFRINNGGTTVRNLTVNGNVTVNSGASFSVSSGNANHWLNVYGDFTNNGSVDFANSGQYSEAGNGSVKLKFLGASNNNMVCNGTTDLYRLFLNKGTDKTYSLTVNASSTANFKLFGPVSGASLDGADGAAGWQRLPIVLTYGTLKLESNIQLERIGENRTGTAPNEFTIPVDARLWINGGNLTTSTSTGDQNGITIFGTLQMSAGTITVPADTRGISYGTSGDAASILKIEGGTIYSTQLVPYGGATKFNYIQTGGELHFNNQPDNPWNNPTFQLAETTLGFDMTGGQITFSDANNYWAGDFYVAIAEGNYNVTGGTIEIQTLSAATFDMYTTIPLYNLNVVEGVGTQAVTIVDQNGNTSQASSLTVLNDITIGANTTLTDNGYNILLTGDFTVTGNYTQPGSILLVGDSDATLTNNSGSTLTFGGLQIWKDIHPTPGSYYTVSLAGANGFEIDGTLKLTRGAFDPVDFTAAVTDSVIITDGDLTSSGTGGLSLTGSSQQILKGRFGKEQEFGRITLDNTASLPQVKLVSDINLTSITFNRDQVIDLDVYNLTIASADFTGGSWGTNRMFRTPGDASNGGLTLPIVLDGTNGTKQIFPLGTTSGYSPATIEVQNTPTDTGTMTVKYDDGYHPTVDDPTGVVDFFWRVSYSGLASVTTSDMRYIFTHYNAIPNLPSGRGMVFQTDNTWFNAGTDVRSGNDLDFDYGDPLNVDYTYGRTNAFNNVRTLYSKASGNFNATTTWTENSSHAGADANPAPRSFDMLVIGGASGVNHTVTASANNADASQVFIKGKSDTGIGVGDDLVEPPTLKIAHGTSGHDIEVVKGNGRLVYENNYGYWSYFTLINGDHTELCNSSEAIIEYTGTGAGPRIIPNSTDIPYYPNLVLSGSAGTTQTTNSMDLYVTGDLTVESATFLLDGNYSETVSVEGDVIIDAGTLTYEATGVRYFEVEGDILFTGAGTFNTTGAAENLLYLKGDITQAAGTIDFDDTGSGDLTLYWQGDALSTYTSGGGIADFSRIEINKSSGQKAHFTSDFNLTGATNGSTKALELINGECHLDHADINIDLSTGGLDFAIPSGTTLRVDNGAQVNVGGASDDTGISLGGSLIVDNGGKVYCNQGSGGFTDNYIEYTASGNATLWIGDNAELIVGSQIRRSTTSDGGILLFTQNASTSTVTVGQNEAPANTRGVFEILNTGSSFTQVAGANITIENGQSSPSIAALYFDPTTVSIGTGAGFTLGSATTVNTDIGIYSGQNFENITIDGTNSPVIDVWIIDCNIDGDLTIGAGATFDANGLDLYMGGDLSNNGTFTPGLNTVYFNGSVAQSITGSGAITFSDMVVNNDNQTVTIANAGVSVSNDLTITAGTLNTGANNLNVEGNVSNNDSIASTGASLGVILNSVSDQQQISGSGVFGRIMIDNSNGISMPSQSSALNIGEKITMEDGVLDIGRNLMVLAKDATFDPGTTYAGDYTANNMVQTNLSFTDAGIRKYLPSGASTDVVYPLGSFGKYTPMIVDITANGNDTGSLRIKAANERHVSIVNDVDVPELVDTANVLWYNWTLDADGLTGFDAEIKMVCDATDIKLDGQVVTDYITARFALGSDTVYKFTVDDFIEADTLRFTYVSAEDVDIDGDYTAGIDPAIPDKVPAFISVVEGGNWEDASTWAAYDPDTETIGAPGAAGVPKGAIIYLDHTVNVTADNKVAFRTQLNATGKLVLGTTKNHRLGDVSGTGTIVVESGSLPAGVYDEFFSATGGTLEYAGSTDYSILSQSQTVNGLVFSGTGTRSFPNYPIDGITVYGDFTINGPTVEAYVGQDLSIGGDLTLTSGVFNANTGNVIFNGSATQTISGIGFTSANSSEFYNFEIDNGQKINVTCDIEVDNILYLTSGLMDTQLGGVLTVTNSSNAAIVQAVSTSYIDGALRKNILSSGNFAFPIGKTGRIGDIEVSSTSGNDYWVVEYFNQSPVVDNLDPTSYLAPLNFVTLNEYWQVKAESAMTALVKCDWDATSGLPADQTERETWRMVEWKTTPDPDEWQVVGNVFSGGHTQSIGSITIDAAASFNEIAGTGNYFTFGTTSLTTFDWEGDVSADWSTAGNWSSGIVPGAGSDVTIVAGTPNNAEITGDAQAKDITISSGTLTVNEGSTLTLNGDLTGINNGLIVENTDANPSSVIFNGIVTPDVQFNWTYTNLADDAVTYRYWYISHCITDATTAPYEAGITGTYVLYQSISKNVWVNLAGGALSGDEMEGYAFALVNSGQTIAHQGQVNNATSYSRTLGDDWYLVANPYPSYVDLDRESDWDFATALKTVYVPTNKTGTLVHTTYNVAEGIGTNGGSRYIAPGQSYWLRAYGAGSFVVNSGARTHGTSAALKSAHLIDSDVLRLNIGAGSYTDEVAMAFRSSGNEEFSDNDSEKKLVSSAPYAQIYSLKSGKRAAIDIQPLINSGKDIPLGFTSPQAGMDLSIRATNINFFNSDYDVYLVDVFKKVVTNLRLTDTYSFTTSEQFDDDRFFIRMSPVVEDIATTVERSSLEEVEVYVRDDSQLVVVIPVGGDCKVEVLSLSGSLIFVDDFTGTKFVKELDVEHGVYIVKVLTGSNEHIEKVIIK